MGSKNLATGVTRAYQATSTLNRKRSTRLSTIRPRFSLQYRDSLSLNKYPRPAAHTRKITRPRLESKKSRIYHE